MPKGDTDRYILAGLRLKKAVERTRKSMLLFVEACTKINVSQTGKKK